MPTKIIANTSFIDYTQNNESTNAVYCLNSDATADTLGIFSSEDKVIEAIDKAIEEGADPSDLWGIIYPIDMFIAR